MNVQAVLQWLALLQQLEQKGEGAYAAVKQVLADHGVEADTAALDGVIADAARRKAQAERDAVAPASAGALGVHAGSTGD